MELVGLEQFAGMDAYVIVDNQLALNEGWDDKQLRIELAELQSADFDITLIGFEDDELARLLAAEDACSAPH